MKRLPKLLIKENTTFEETVKAEAVRRAVIKNPALKVENYKPDDLDIGHAHIYLQRAQVAAEKHKKIDAAEAVIQARRDAQDDRYILKSKVLIDSLIQAKDETIKILEGRVDELTSDKIYLNQKLESLQEELKFLYIKNNVPDDKEESNTEDTNTEDTILPPSPPSVNDLLCQQEGGAEGNDLVIVSLAGDCD